MDSRPIKSLELRERKADLFEGLPDVSRLFTGMADYLSLWCALYGLREQNIRCSSLAWVNAHTLVFRVMDNRGAAISPLRYDPRLPDIPKVFVARAERIRRFVGLSPWYRRLLKRVDTATQAYLGRWELQAGDVELTNRWTADGFVVMFFVWKNAPATQNRYMTHLKYGDMNT